MNRYRLLFSIILLLFFSPCLRAGEWQWSVTLDGFVSNETNRNPTAFLWIPADCMQIKAIIVGQHNMSEETLFDNPLFREKMQKLGIGFVWITPGIDQQWDVSKGTQQIFEKMMISLANVSGYSELKNVPIVPIGHSAMATYPWNFAAWNPERTLAIISLHGDAPRTNLTGYGRENLEWGRTRNIDGIPGLMIEGEYEWWEARVNPALAFRMMYPESCISFLCDAGRGHFDVADETAAYIALFLEKAINQRLTDEVTKDGKVKLNPVNPTKGWLAERWHPNQKKRAKAAFYSQYKGDVHDAGQELAAHGVHGWDHQHQTLGGCKGGGQGASLQGTVAGAGSTGLRLHLDDVHRGAEQVLPPLGGPLVHLLRHGRGRGDGIDARYLGKGIGNIGGGFVAVTDFQELAHIGSSSHIFAAAPHRPPSDLYIHFSF